MPQSGPFEMQLDIHCFGLRSQLACGILCDWSLRSCGRSRLLPEYLRSFCQKSFSYCRDIGYFKRTSICSLACTMSDQEIIEDQSLCVYLCIKLLNASPSLEHSMHIGDFLSGKDAIEDRSDRHMARILCASTNAGNHFARANPC